MIVVAKTSQHKENLCLTRNPLMRAMNPCMVHRILGRTLGTISSNATGQFRWDQDVVLPNLASNCVFWLLVSTTVSQTNSGTLDKHAGKARLQVSSEARLGFQMTAEPLTSQVMRKQIQALEKG